MMAQSAALASQQLQKGISPGVQASGPFKKIISQSQRGNAMGNSRAQNAQNAAAQKARAATAARSAGVVAGTMMCWVARASWGENNPRWEAFRDSMLDYAPTWFVALYAAHGEKVAKHINTPFRRSVSRCILSSLQTLWTPNVAREAHKLA